MAACILLPVSALVREKERGTIEQLLVSPLTPFQIMFSKVLAMIVVLLSPLRHFIEIAYGILLRGADLATLRDSVFWLLLGFALFGLGVARFRRQLA